MKRTVTRVLSLFLSLLLLCSVAPLRPLVRAAALITGDVNLDGKVGSDDARLVLRASVKLEVLRDDALRCADADHDTNITAGDARLILRASVGLEKLSPMPTTTRTVVYQSKGLPATKLTFPGNKAETLGSINETGLTLEVEPGSLTAGTVISATPLTKDQFNNILPPGTLERAMFPMNITCEGYDGAFFDDGIRLTVPLMEDSYDGNTDYDLFVFCYYDETAKEIRYFFPDEIDTEAHTMTISLPHFSPWWGAKLTEAERIELYLDRYCMQLAVQQSDRKMAASELEPYLKAKAEALELTANATKDLVECAVNYIGGSFVFEDEGSQQVGTFISMGTSYTTTMLRAFYDNDKGKAKEALSNAANCALQQAWSELKFSERAASVFKSKTVKEFAPGAIDTLLSNFGSIGTVLGCLSADDPEGALQAVGDILQNTDPNVALATKAIAFVGTILHTGFTFWKANQIEELYHLYKNGGDFLFGNEVIPRNRQSFLTFLNTSSGFTLAKGVKRFFNLDKIADICKKYGWSFKDYSSMPQKYRDIFEKRAEEGLLTYFETRAAQEDEAGKLKETEREVINTMLYEDLGALKRTNFHKFFHDDYSTYDVVARLERLVRVKAFIAQYVDETKLNADKYNNWGDMLNQWIYYASNFPKTEALGKFINDLKQLKLLRDGMDVEYKRSAVRQFFGEWVGYYNWYVFREYVQKEGTKWTFEPVYDEIRTKYTYTIGLDLQGRLSIRCRQEDVELNGQPYKNPQSVSDGTAHLDDKEYQVNGGTLIVPSKDHVGGYRYKFTGSLNSYETHTQWDSDKGDFVDYEICIECKKVSEISGRPTS